MKDNKRKQTSITLRLSKVSNLPPPQDDIQPLFIRLSKNTKCNITLTDNLLLDIGNVKWIKWNGTTVEYLYFLLEILFDMRNDQLVLKYMENGMDADEDEDGWNDCEEHEDIRGGWYVVYAGPAGVIPKKLSFLTG